MSYRRHHKQTTLRIIPYVKKKKLARTKISYSSRIFSICDSYCPRGAVFHWGRWPRYSRSTPRCHHSGGRKERRRGKWSCTFSKTFISPFTVSYARYTWFLYILPTIYIKGDTQLLYWSSGKSLLQNAMMWLFWEDQGSLETVILTLQKWATFWVTLLNRDEHSFFVGKLLKINLPRSQGLYLQNQGYPCGTDSSNASNRRLFIAFSGNCENK